MARDAHLGIAYGHTATVAAIRGGALVFCESEERRNRLKGSSGFPTLVLDHVYREVLPAADIASCTLFQTSALGYHYLKSAGFRSHRGSGLANDAFKAQLVGAGGARMDDGLVAAIARERASQWTSPDDPATSAEAAAYFSKATGLTGDRVLLADHHVCHALSVLPFLRAPGPVLVFTLDGMGDGVCASVVILDGASARMLSQTLEPRSIGMVYQLVTGMLGMRMNEDEYKVMGLAPYAERAACKDIEEEMARLLWVDGDGEWQAAFGITEILSAKLAELLRFRRFDHVAGALQAYLETMTCRWVSAWVRRTGIRRIACAGGVFMNVKANGAIAGLPDVEDLAVTPSAADESTAIGAAIHGHLASGESAPIAPAAGIYLGSRFDDGAVDRAIQAAGAGERYRIERPADMAGRVAALLAEGEIVARFDGAAEFGARALGNRSILAHPGRLDVVDKINQSIKQRDFWMPFAPSLMAEEAGRYVVDPKGLASPYMMVGLPATAEGQARLPAALHRADRTMRPQIVRRDWNPAFHALIAAFGRLTGTWAVLNTSFNLHGEPIVGSPEDAIRTLDRSGLRWLALGPYLMHKSS
ncbi:MAG: carbamoyl transferase [Alphaproteobacteria bacterium]|nr:carbamoyl transferase [Alphaproteobacteria bacterium]